MMTDYVKAYKQGKKEYQNRSSRGERATLLALDKMLPVKGTYTEVPLGIVQIPIDRLVGTKTETRSNAFARKFYAYPRRDNRVRF